MLLPYHAWFAKVTRRPHRKYFGRIYDLTIGTTAIQNLNMVSSDFMVHSLKFIRNSINNVFSQVLTCLSKVMICSTASNTCFC